ncbi:uncharacterized protein TEOVI_000479400 [Trypanosoma equiperdum]|uniref:Uncharacterized protein n=2 Tax=Trypanozoon TaxID=39700 RepID=Q381N4_TRYB2|nr:hypothetical protein, conserved [Trypanosoma brucei brucei TREU927]EAN80497.1 hypothetical protein, conserved [Trypanosoma brucei brucei TREU927]SCU65277.1 hypothetical protein, conserved [Trypanosoma equiperdum]
MVKRSPSPSVDSVERIYDMLCAAQLKANTEEEEIRALRLLIATAEVEIKTAQESMRELQEQHEEASREVSVKKSTLEEQRHRCVGAVEALASSREALTREIEDILRSELPPHPAVSAVKKTVRSSYEIISPAKLRDAALSLRRKIEEAIKHHHLCCEQNQSPSSIGDGWGDSKKGFRHSFVVHFKCAEAAVSNTGDEAAGAVPEPRHVSAARVELNVGKDANDTLGKRKRKVITFDDEQLEAHSAAFRPSAAAVATPRPSSISCDLTIIRPRLPRRTLWRAEQRELS